MKTSLFKKRVLTCAIIFCGFFAQIKSQVTVTLQPGPQDGFDTPIGTWGSSNYNNTNFNAMFELVSKALTVSGDCSIARSLLRFDLSAIPVNAVVQSASLSLFYISGVNPAHSGSNSSYLRRVTSAWSNTLVTWNTEPTTTSVGQATIAQSTSPTQDYTIDVTAMTSYMIANPQSNHGFEFGLFNEACERILTFGSSKNSNPAKRPRLIVQYMSTATDLDQNTLSKSMRIYPNPSKGIIEIRSDAENLRLNVYNLFGELVFTKEISGTHELIDLSHLNSGAYMYSTVSASAQKTSGKLILQ
jgi:hypothetical protein